MRGEKIKTKKKIREIYSTKITMAISKKTKISKIYAKN